MNRIMVKSCVIVMCAAALLGLNTGCAMFESKEQIISINELPAAVKSQAEKEVAGCKVKEVEKEKKHGKVIYTIDYEQNGTEMELEYSEDGKLISKGKE
ncbi:MAG: PepSY-like domain-containing protein [Lentisphaerota bacterium]